MREAIHGSRNLVSRGVRGTRLESESSPANPSPVSGVRWMLKAALGEEQARVQVA